MTLAIHGGPQIRQREDWPQWPICTPESESRALHALRSGRWAVSGPSIGEQSEEARFAAEFASFHSAKHCIPVDHGSNAIVCALAALGVGAGDEVIVPALTWVACASAVVRLNAVPVLVDIDPETLCLCPEAVEAAINDRTRVILVVHLYCSVCDLDALLAVAERHEVAIVEDCAQAHGAEWDGHKVGTLGRVGVFSFQQGKPLTCGEGGACITDDGRLAEAIYRFRTDGRSKLCEVADPGRREVFPSGESWGFNACLSEVQCAIVSEQLARLEEQNALRRQNAMALRDALGAVPGIRFPSLKPKGMRFAVYHFAFRVDRQEFGGATNEAIGAAVSGELGLWVHPPYEPIHRSPLFRPRTSPAVGWSDGYVRRLPGPAADLPNAEDAHRTWLVFHHSALMGESEHLEAIVAAVRKVRAHAHRLPATQE